MNYKKITFSYHPGFFADMNQASYEIKISKFYTVYKKTYENSLLDKEERETLNKKDIYIKKKTNIFLFNNLISEFNKVDKETKNNFIYDAATIKIKVVTENNKTITYSLIDSLYEYNLDKVCEILRLMISELGKELSLPPFLIDPKEYIEDEENDDDDSFIDY